MIYKLYSESEVREIADQQRQNLCRYPNVLPIDVETIIEFKLGIEIRPVQFQRSGTDYLGMLSHDLKTIYVDNFLYVSEPQENRLRFTLAHELGHYFLHGSFLRQQKFNSIEEWISFHQEMEESELSSYERNCNEFAGRFLVPRNLLQVEVTNLSDEIERLRETAESHNKFSEHEINERIRNWIASKIHSRFKVAPKTLEIRLRKEGISI